MDQVRDILNWLKRHHFWVLSGIVAVVALGCWYSASGALYDEFRRNESTIKTQFTAVDGLTAKDFIANPDINQRQRQEIVRQREDVNRIWQQVYERQREYVLRWPMALSERFRDQVEKLKFEDEIPGPLRDEYMNYIDNHFPELPKMIGARELPLGEMMGGGGRGYGRGGMGRGMGEMGMGRGGYGGGRGGLGGRGERSFTRGEGGYSPYLGELDEEEEGDYLVEWLDQSEIRAELYFPERPSSIEVWVAQENLWVYHTLLDVIRNTNEAAGADRHSNAAIRTIYALEVGQPAALGARTPGRIWMPEVAAAPRGEMDPYGEGGVGIGPEGAGVYGERGGEYGMMPGMMEGFGEGEMGAAGDQERVMLLTGRYLDAEGQPIPVSGPTKTPGEFGTEYKRLPVRMELEMDVRWLSHLVAQCASQPLQVEVEEVRINPMDTGGMGGGRGGYGGGRGGGEGGRGYGGGMGSGSPFQSTGRMGELSYFKAHPNIATVVIQGIIYIFNEPDPGALEGTEDQLAALGE